jgi:hypothetical protein
VKTASELGITEAEWAALQVVAAGLAAGEYVHNTGANRRTGRKMFNMNIPCDALNYKCGTVACIGGWAALQMGMSPGAATAYVTTIDTDSPIESLYFPKSTAEWDNVTPAIAAKAIYQFLDGEKIDYAALLRDAA